MTKPAWILLLTCPSLYNHSVVIFCCLHATHHVTKLLVEQEIHIMCSNCVCLCVCTYSCTYYVSAKLFQCDLLKFCYFLTFTAVNNIGLMHVQRFGAVQIHLLFSQLLLSCSVLPSHRLVWSHSVAHNKLQSQSAPHLDSEGTTEGGWGHKKEERRAKREGERKFGSRLKL